VFLLTPLLQRRGRGEGYFLNKPMFKNYFKTAWRNIIRSKGYSLLNISGLAIGMAVALLIGLWVYYQYSYDNFFLNTTGISCAKKFL